MEKSPFRSIRGVLWIVGVILFPAPIALGHADLAVTSIVRNVGNLNSGSYSIDYYAAISPSTMTSGYRLGTAGGNPLDRSRQETVSTTCQFPLDMTEGKYFICAKVACSGDVNPGNDTGYDGALVWVGPFSDLAVQSVDAADGTCMSGGQILVRSVVQNVGDRISDGYVVHYYVSLDTTVTTRDPCIGSESLAALAPGEQRACGITCQLPLYSPEGKCYIGAIITCPSDPNPQNDCGVDGTAVEMIRLFSDNGMSFPYLGPSTAVEGFETSDFSAFAWIHPTDVRWIVTPDVRHQGAYSARTGILGNSQKIALEISIKVDGGPIRFWRKVSTEEGFDRFQFLIDGSVMCEWSGEHDWEQFAFSVQPGTHTFTWTYGKNYTTAEGADAVWIDDIEFPIW